MQFDFVSVIMQAKSKNKYNIFPDFNVSHFKDLMIRGGTFYAIWDSDHNIWSTDIYDAITLIDKYIYEESEKIIKSFSDEEISFSVLYLKNYNSGMFTKFLNFMKDVHNQFITLDMTVTFASDIIDRESYVSKKLPYDILETDISSYNELMDTIYDPEEREKIEWAIGCVLNGSVSEVQKFLVLYGKGGTGKSTVLHIIEDLFQGYYTIFDAKSMGNNYNVFATAAFKNNPLIALQHDGDLSHIEDNTKINSIVAHEDIIINEKFEKPYIASMNAMLFLGTNSPVKITDSRSGIIRRLIDVHPSGRLIPFKKFNIIKSNIKFELSGIAYHCREVFRKLGPQYYETYKPLGMMEKTDIFYNFMEENYFFFKNEEYISLRDAYKRYKAFCEESLVQYPYPINKFRSEFENYFDHYYEQKQINGERHRSMFSGLKTELFTSKVTEWDQDSNPYILTMDDNESDFDKLFADLPAQYATTKNEIPKMKWENVKTTLSDLDTKEIHYVKLPINHIVIDFDLKDENKEKSLDLNLEAASKWPNTYGEISKGGSGVHLHYIYSGGDPEKLSRVYEPGIEVKVFNGDSSLRRKLSRCHNAPIATLVLGSLPLKEEKDMINFEGVKNEKALRTILSRAMHKEYFSSTKQSIDFICYVLDQVYNSDLDYNVQDMYNDIFAFAANSTNKSDYCLKQVKKMHFMSKNNNEKEEKENTISEEGYSGKVSDDKIIFFDVEVFKNLFVLVVKPYGKKCIRLINPSASDVYKWLKFPLAGFNCIRYDNHILYAKAILNYTNMELFNLSQSIINKDKNCFFYQAYNLSYLDIFEMSSKKQSLKKFEIEYGLKHHELGLDWNEEVPEELWETVADYCCDDVIATEEVFKNKKRYQDYIGRCILAELSGLPINATTQKHAAKIIFGDDKNPQDKFVYTDLSEMFEGYVFDNGKSTYRGEEVGEGGYVYAEPGMYTWVGLDDVESMHPNSIINLNLFGPFTKNFKQLLDSRLAIKHHNFESVKMMLDGKLAKYLGSDQEADDLSYALKIVINIVYGMTSAPWDNPFRDPRNIDNIVAKRGALFMIDLKNACQHKGISVMADLENGEGRRLYDNPNDQVVAHIKTDSIKIPNATKEAIQYVNAMGKNYGYNFDHEATYEKMCLVNNAVYIAKYATAEDCEKLYGYIPKDNLKHGGEWTATGTQFQVPYVFKTLFSHEKIEFEDMCEIKTCQTEFYLDRSELTNKENDLEFVGKVGQFVPMKKGHGYKLLRKEKDGRMSAATGTKGYYWREADQVKGTDLEKFIDRSYYDRLVDEAVSTISKYGDFEWFVSDDPVALPKKSKNKKKVA